MLMTVKALTMADTNNSLKSFCCNYNEVEEAIVAKRCLELIVEGLQNINYVEFKGNDCSPKD